MKKTENVAQSGDAGLWDLQMLVCPKQLRLLTHLGCTCKVGIAQIILKQYYVTLKEPPTMGKRYPAGSEKLKVGALPIQICFCRGPMSTIFTFKRFVIVMNHYHMIFPLAF